MKYNAGEIYKKLENYKSNAIVKSVFQKEGVSYARSVSGVFSLRVLGSKFHFGNPFSSNSKACRVGGLVKVKSIREAVVSYIGWVLNSRCNFYSGDVSPGDGKVFVFGSNLEGRHGLGSAKVAKDSFGAVYGIGEGYQGNSYAIPTKDLRVKGYRSIKEYDIIKSIKKFYIFAGNNTNLNFYVAYRNTDGKSYNGYSGLEMIDMFNKAGVAPNNVLFSEEWYNTGLLLNFRAEWIRGILDAGLLKGKSIIYYKNLGEPSHADALCYLINNKITY